MPCFKSSDTEEVPGSIRLSQGNSLPLQLGVPYHRSRILEIFIYMLEGNFSPNDWPEAHSDNEINRDCQAANKCIYWYPNDNKLILLEETKASIIAFCRLTLTYCIIFLGETLYIYVYLYYTLPDDLGIMLGHFGVRIKGF